MNLLIKSTLSILLFFSCFLLIGFALKIIFKKFFFVCPKCGHISLYRYKSFTLYTKKFKYKVFSCRKCNYKNYFREIKSNVSSF
ncbi:MAG: transposase [Clostridium sp.]